MDAIGIALSGMQSAQTRVAVSAHNVANLLTDGFRPQRAVQTSVSAGGSQASVAMAASPESVSFDQEIIDQIVAKNQYEASARVLSVSAEMRGSLLDLFT